MNENINLCEILKRHEGETFYSPICGKDIKLKAVYPHMLSFEGNVSSFLPNGAYNEDGECLIFPSKDQRDWNKWIEEQKSKIPKTWSELKSTKGLCPKILGCKSDSGGIYDGIEKDTPIEKSALALLKIHQLIEVGYGGNVTNKLKEFYSISYDIQDKRFIIRKYKAVIYDNFILTFHTEGQAEEFLSKSENVQLLKDYFMINE